MKKLLLLVPLLFLAACEPTDEPEPIALAVEAATERIEESMISPEGFMIYPYFEQWEMCIINGEVYNDVAFQYTDLGLGYVHNGTLTYTIDMEVSYCERPILQEVKE